MRKVDNGKRKKKDKKIMWFLVTTNVVASQPPERRVSALCTVQCIDPASCFSWLDLSNVAVYLRIQ